LARRLHVVESIVGSPAALDDLGVVNREDALTQRVNYSNLREDEDLEIARSGRPKVGGVLRELGLEVANLFLERDQTCQESDNGDHGFVEGLRLILPTNRSSHGSRVRQGLRRSCWEG